jgi:hypothetical protein
VRWRSTDSMWRTKRITQQIDIRLELESEGSKGIGYLATRMIGKSWTDSCLSVRS